MAIALVRWVNEMSSTAIAVTVGFSAIASFVVTAIAFCISATNPPSSQGYIYITIG